MTGALIILAVTALTGLILWITRDKGTSESADSGKVTEVTVPGDTPEGCCGRHAICDKIIETGAPVYFDDEELDRFAGRAPEEYSPEEIEEFRRVLYTLLPEDVYPWGISLTSRNIPLPLSLRDEWIMLCGDRDK